tara:strand:- start:1207 stop:1809 length:603 start_codon:yes stop_codon:yes gene_type:complete
MKKSFILHNDSLDILDELTDEQAGKLFKAIRSFNIGIELTLEVDIKMLFLHFKNQFIRDGLKYQEKSIINAASGSKGGLAKVANATKRKRTLKSVATLADKDSDNEKDNDKIDFSLFWNLYPRKEEKKTAATKWEKLPKETQEKIIKTLPHFLKGKDVKFVPMPVTYFNNERWDDELSIEPVMSEEERKAEITRNFLARL